MRGDEQQLGVFLLALHLGVHPGERRLEIVRDMLVELLILLVADLSLGP
jgi:uncharacterized membrane protein